MNQFKGRHELKYYINYCDVLELRARLPFIANLDTNSGRGNGKNLE